MATTYIFDPESEEKQVEKQLGLDQCRLMECGLDWLALSFWGKYSERSVLSQLMQVRDAANEAGEAITTVIEGRDVKVWPRGAQSGITWYQLRLQIMGCTVLANPADAERDGTTMPNVQIEIPGLMWLNMGGQAEGLYKLILEWLSYERSSSTVRRLDVAYDFLGDLGPLCDWIFAGHSVNKRLTFRRHKVGQIDTGLSIEGGDVVIRIYNKLEELKGQPDKFDSMVCNRYGGEIPENAWRIEFQFRTKALKRADDLREIEAVLGNLPSIVMWCCHQWCRPVAYRSDTHTSRNYALPFWGRLHEEIDLGEPVPVVPVEPVASPAKLAKSSASVLARSAALLGYTGAEPVFDLVSNFFHAFGCSVGADIDFIKKLREVRADLVAAGKVQPNEYIPRSLPIEDEELPTWRTRSKNKTMQMKFDDQPEYLRVAPSVYREPADDWLLDEVEASFS